MNTQVARISIRENLQRFLEGLICLAAPALVLSGTLAICFPTVALAG